MWALVDRGGGWAGSWSSPRPFLTELPIVAASQKHVGILGVVLQGDKRRGRLQDNFRLVGVFCKTKKKWSYWV